MRSAAQFAAEISHTDDADAVRVFLSSKRVALTRGRHRDRTTCGRDGKLLGNAGVHFILDLDKLLAGDRLGLREVEPQPVLVDFSTRGLGSVAPQRLLQGKMQ